jgi:competence protein ComEC
MQGMTTEKLLTSVPEQLTLYSPIACKAGQSWNWDQVEFTLLSPPQAAFSSENNQSCVLKIQSGHGTVLLTGDIEAEAESSLVATYGDKLQADVLIAPHHGSKTSSTLSFLQTVQPKYILIPTGYRNQFGHPHKEVLERYKNSKAILLNTADSGAISVNMKEDTWNLQAYRDTASRYWNFDK